ncbi:hypothetical protein HG536_0A06470 [Torulaspora globosa]|uniref:Uncharacterized protein n=1 Tax=Torulaspora globosa TaxID=48254 RepID=A0A7G3ZBE6_9SACH|nr:uncharacterized protein HG536_0A06470 [Torulaspora globosa]QLL30832.1 hypothetical protein HG536_0A06470 [Torulaspora globosa]
MGIQGLLPQLKPIQNPVSLLRYEGLTLGIDGYAWLHRAACCCSYELANGLPTAKYLKFFIKKISMLRSFKIEPFFIFDGDAIGVKKDTEVRRREKRIENKAIGERLWNMGEKSSAMDYFQKCVDVTPEMAKCIIDYCKVNRIQYIVAPFEADAQMVYLEKQRIIHGIISEDSDLLIFGCKRLITKLNDFGECIEICRDDFDKLPEKFPLSQLTDDQVRLMVCLSGCDYTAGVPKVGLITAMKLVKRFHTLDRVLMNIQREGKLSIPANFEHETRFANFAFQFQRVFCPIRRRLVTLNEVPEHLANCQELYDSIGHVIDRNTQVKECVMDDDRIHHDLHLKIAIGDLSPYDFRKRLVNREHKLQLSSKSDLQVELHDNTPKKRSIDSFFSKKKDSGAKENVLDRIIALKTPIVDKLEETIKRRKLSDNNTVISTTTTSKFFSSTQQDEDEIETEVPESQLPTQISSLSPAQSDLQGNRFNDDEEEEEEVLSELEPDNHTNSPSPALSSQPTAKVSANYAPLQRFRYSGSREPLQDKNVNQVDRIVYISAKRTPSTVAEQQSARPSLSRRPTTQAARRIVVTAASTESTKSAAGQSRPALRSLSLSSRFSYSATTASGNRRHN